MIRHLPKGLLPFLLLLFSCCSCSGGGGGEDSRVVEESGAAGSAASETKGIDSEVKGAEGDAEEMPMLAMGAHYAYGIRMPRGMMPTRHPNGKVYRFEGTHSIVTMKRYLVHQLKDSGQMSEENGEIRIRQAKAKISDDDAAQREYADRKVAIRIFPGSLRGAAVDVWLETEETSPFRSSSDKSGASGYNPRTGERLPMVILGNGPRLETKQERVNSTFEVIEKISRGEKLTAEDYNSPFFTEQR